jgi:hypothetical protein
MAYGPNMLGYPFSDITITVWIYGKKCQENRIHHDSPVQTGMDKMG